MRDARNWRPLDGRETNFNITSNQASDGGKALTELMTNMVDAVLMKYALNAGIDPKGRKAPRTMHEAVDKLIKPLRGGKLTEFGPERSMATIVLSIKFGDWRYWSEIEEDRATLLHLRGQRRGADTR